MKHYTKRNRKPKSPENLSPTTLPVEPEQEIRFAVVNGIHCEVLSAQHRVIGEAFNSMNEGYVSTDGAPLGLLVVAHTPTGEVLYPVDHRGKKRKTSKTIPSSIWGGAKHPFYEPKAKSVEAFTNLVDIDLMSDLNQNFIKALDAMEKKNATPTS